MKAFVEDLIKFRCTMSIDLLGDEINKEQFDKFLASWSKAKVFNYSNADVWISPWMGKMKWVAMYRFDTEKYYKLSGE